MNSNLMSLFILVLKERNKSWMYPALYFIYLNTYQYFSVFYTSSIQAEKYFRTDLYTSGSSGLGLDSNSFLNIRFRTWFKQFPKYQV